jgi:NADPH:quinone reductase-like Zn-dependent oxidoreductase
VELVRSLGADTVIDYTQEVFARGGERYDLMVDIAGSRPWSECKRVLREGGTYVCAGAASVQHGRGGSARAIGRLLWLRVASTGSGRRYAFFIARISKADLQELGEMVGAGSVRPVIEKTYDLAGAGAALAGIDAGHRRGKLAIEIAGS